MFAKMASNCLDLSSWPVIIFQRRENTRDKFPLLAHWQKYRNPILKCDGTHKWTTIQLIKLSEALIVHAAKRLDI